MSDYDNNMSGVLFKNDRKETDAHPHAKGSAEVAGVKYWVQAWTNTDKNGRKYQRLSFTPKDEATQRGQSEARRVVSPPADDDLDDDLPF